MNLQELDTCVSYVRMSTYIKSLHSKLVSQVDSADVAIGLSSWLARVQGLVNLYEQRVANYNEYISAVIPIESDILADECDLLTAFPNPTQMQPCENNLYLLVTEMEYNSLLPCSIEEERWFFLCEIRIVRDYHTQYGEYVDLDV